MRSSGETPVDLAAVQADDRWLEELNDRYLHGVRERLDTDSALARVLLAWRRDVNAEPIGELVDPRAAVARIRSARREQRLRRCVETAVAVLAALAIVAAVVGLFPGREWIYSDGGE